jgi:hypothetical protein
VIEPHGDEPLTSVIEQGDELQSTEPTED